MSARILIVDDLAPNLHLLQVKLSAEYYDVLLASSGVEALEIVQEERVDLILMDAIMPEMDGFETCQKLKNDPETYHIPVIMVTALDSTKDRIRGLEAGADDFITKPFDDFNLMARVKSLLRLKMVTDQLLGHTGHTLANSRTVVREIEKRKGHIVVLEDHEKRALQIAAPLQDIHRFTIVTNPAQVLNRRPGDTDLIIVSLSSDNFDGLRVCASLKFDHDTRTIPILLVGTPDDENRFVRAYDLGINDTLMRPIEKQELIARVNTQLKRKFYSDALQENFNQDLEMVVADPLTGLGNRRYFDRSVSPLFDNVARGEEFSIIVFDIDHFKRVNDILGHDVGDDILKEVATRLVTHMRAIDIVSRYGGEEFMIAMPNTNQDDALLAADRIRSLIGGTPIFVSGQALSVTVSAGVAQVRQGEKLRDVFKRADSALYVAKREGRNKVVPAATKKAA
ncbi:MAG: PleD family two-component system response regulator [Hellea sp.]|nr:PleD family two-component system response regulator [Hellea sp.]